MTLTNDGLTPVTEWIKNYLDNAVPHAKYQAIVGLSGGIDSAVVASLCAKAVGPEKVLGVILPCESNNMDEDLAWNLAESLGVHVHVCPLGEAFNRWRLDYRHNIGERPSTLTLGNTKARFRMLTLYALAAQYGGLVIGTTNKTEAILRFATKYGDNAVDIEPIMDFYKTEIWEMANLLGDIPQEIITRVPTAGLWEGQTDEGELGMTYADIDQCLMEIDVNSKDYVENWKFSKLPVLRQILNRYKQNQHKDFHLPHYSRKA